MYGMNFGNIVFKRSHWIAVIVITVIGGLVFLSVRSGAMREAEAVSSLRLIATSYKNNPKLFADKSEHERFLRDLKNRHKHRKPIQVFVNILLEDVADQ